MRPSKKPPEDTPQGPLDNHAWWRDTYPDHPQLWPLYEDFKVFTKYVWRHLNLPPPTPIQLDIADYLQFGPRRRIIEAFRGVGKSYVTSAFVCWALLRNPDLAIMVVSASKVRADDFSTFTKRLIREVDVLNHLVPGKDQRDANVAFDVGPATAKHAPSVKSVGITGQLAGSRADIIVADDIEIPTNSETQNMRDKIAEAVKEFDAVLKPSGHVLFLGTPQTEQSLYNKLRERGYDCRVWPSEIPNEEYLRRMQHLLSPYIIERVKGGLKFGHSTDPKRFSNEDLAERKMSYGGAGYSLQFLLDTTLSDAQRYPLKLRDLIVMELDDKKGPTSVVWSPTKALVHSDLFTPGLDGDAFYMPAYQEPRWAEYQGSVLYVDPSGRGQDETSWCVAKLLYGTIFVPVCRGNVGGYDDQVLRAIAVDAKIHEVSLVLVESNFGQGMFEKLLIPHLHTVGHKAAVEGVRNSRQKELRIIDTLEPLMSQHRLVVGKAVVEQDNTSVQNYPQDKQTSYRLFYQMTRLTRAKGALVHDDRLEALAGAVSYWVEAMAIDQKKAADKANERAMDQEIREHLRWQLSEAFGGPKRTTKDREKGSFLLAGKPQRRQ